MTASQGSADPGLQVRFVSHELNPPLPGCESSACPHRAGYRYYLLLGGDLIAAHAVCERHLGAVRAAVLEAGRRVGGDLEARLLNRRRGPA